LPPPTTEQSRFLEAQHTAQWFTEEVQPHEAALRGWLRRAFPSVRDPDDVVQESLLRLWKARAAHPIQSAKAFLFRVARHVALDSVVAQKRSPIQAVDNLAALPVIEEKADVIEAISANEKVRIVAAALVALPPRCREVVMLRKLKGLSRAEVAERLGISEKTVDEQLARGVAKLEIVLRAQGADWHFQP
jgi:RNA polymerase sigma factor (sigma-70 family)